MTRTGNTKPGKIRGICSPPVHGPGNRTLAQSNRPYQPANVISRGAQARANRPLGMSRSRSTASCRSWRNDAHDRFFAIDVRLNNAVARVLKKGEKQGRSGGIEPVTLPSQGDVAR